MIEDKKYMDRFRLGGGPFYVCVPEHRSAFFKEDFLNGESFGTYQHQGHTRRT